MFYVCEIIAAYKMIWTECLEFGNRKIMNQMLTQKQGRTLVLHSSNASITVRLRLKHSPHVFPMNERRHTQVHHVPRRAVVVAHKVEGHGNVGMAVIKTQIVLQQNTNS